MWSGLKKAREHKHLKETQQKFWTNKASDENLTKKLQGEQLVNKKRCSKILWYHCNIKCRNEAETELKTHGVKIDGTFLVRSSTACTDDFIISFIYKGQVVHFLIKCHSHIGGYSLSNKNGQGKPAVHDGLEKLIEFYYSESIVGTCKLKESCPGGCSPPPLSMSAGTTNLLHKAITSRKRDLALDILSNPFCPSVDSRNANGCTAMHLASDLGELEIVFCLISKDATVDAIDKQGYTSLHRACLKNHAEVVHHLIVDGLGNPQKRLHPSGDVALHLAAQNGHIETIKALLKLDIPCFPRNYDKVTPYEMALKCGHEECVKLLDNYEAPNASTKLNDWFHDDITNRKEASDWLNQYISQDGYFLVRRSSSDPNKRVLSICFNRKQEHFVIEIFMSAVFIDRGPLLPSLEHLVEYYSTYADGLPCILAVAISPSGELVPMTRQLPFSNSESRGFVPENLPKPIEPLVLDKKKIVIGSELGNGEFGSVLRGKWMAPNGKTIKIAVKTLHEEHMISNKDSFLSEAKIMVKLSHPYIVKLIGICQGPPLMLVQELLMLGSLQNYLLDYPEQVNINSDIPLWAEQVADGMKYLEKEKFVHRDLATRNILLSTKHIAKICDFGLSRAIGTSDYYRASHGGKWPVKWYAPESINYGTFSSASDVWSFGITLWEMYSLGDTPYDNMNGAQVIEFIEKNGRLVPSDNSPQFMSNLMSRCWKYNANERPTFKNIFDELHLYKTT